MATESSEPPKSAAEWVSYARRQYTSRLDHLAQTSSIPITLRPLLEALGRGDVLKQLVGAILVALSILGFIGGIIGLLVAAYQVWRMNPAFTVGVGAFIVLIMGAVMLVLVCHLTFLRGRTIAMLPDAEFTVMTICAIITRLWGEIICAAWIVAGVMQLLLIWIGGESALLWMVGDGLLGADLSMTGNAFIDGIVSLIGTWLIGLLALLISYLVAECIAVLASIAYNTRLTRVAVEGRPPETSAAAPALGTAADH